MKLKTEKEIREIIKICESFLTFDKSRSELKGFPFWAEVNMGHISFAGVRKILLWFLDEQPKCCRRIGDQID